MVSEWEPPEGDIVEIEVEARSSRDGGHAARARPGAATAHSVDAARRGARLLRMVAWCIPATSVLGYVLISFWANDEGMSGESMRQRIGDLLMFIWVPLAIAALVYAASFLLTLAAVRLELDAARRDESPVS